jgi:hypothetical protein
MAYSISPPIPGILPFYGPILIVLGRRTNYQPDVLIKVTDEFRDEVLREAGFDPDNLPEEWIRTRKQKTPAGLNTRMMAAYRFWHHPKKRGRGGAKTISGKSGMWGLTDLGVAEAKKLKPKPNQTARWLNEHLTPERGKGESDLMRIVRATVSRKCRKSADLGIVEDHIQQYFMRLIHRNGLRKKLEAGQKITYTHIASYAVNSAITDIRDASTNPVTREAMGARTSQERAVYATQATLNVHVIKAKRSGLLEETKARREAVGDGRSGLYEIEDQGAMSADALTERLNFEKIWSRLATVMRKAKPNAGDRYVGILKMQLVEGLSVKEIAAAEKVSHHRAATMLQEARRAVRSVGREGLHL